MRQIVTEPLTADAFAPYGEVLAATGDFRLINAGLCQRHHDRATLDFGADGRAVWHPLVLHASELRPGFRTWDKKISKSEMDRRSRNQRRD